MNGKWLMRVLCGMLVVAAVLNTAVWMFPTPAYAGSCVNAFMRGMRACDCGCCGADKAAWHTYQWCYSVCVPGWGWCYVGLQCGTC
jgi:hypothetical protein